MAVLCLNDQYLNAVPLTLPIKEKPSLSEDEQTQLPFICDIIDYSENTKKPYVMEAPLGIT